MSQASNVIPGGAGIGGLATRTSINAALAAIVSGHVGTADPSYKVAGMGWWRSDIPGTGIWTFYWYDGTAKIPLLTMDTANHTLAVAGVSVAPAWAGVRQTVAAGPLGSSGLPTLFPTSNGALSLTTQNVSGVVPLVASAANGWSATTGLPVDAVGYAVANLTWSGLTGSRAAATPNFLYGTIAANGVITPASTILAPVVQEGGTPSTTSGQITINTGEMKAYLGNGSAAVPTSLVLFGEAATDGSGVIGTVAYAYNGRYVGPFTSTLPAAGTPVSANHNLGVVPEDYDFFIECTSADAGYAVGKRLRTGSIYSDNGSSNSLPVALSADRLTIGVVGSTTNPMKALNAGTGADTALTLAKWKYRFVAKRGW